MGKRTRLGRGLSDLMATPVSIDPPVAVEESMSSEVQDQSDTVALGAKTADASALKSDSGSVIGRSNGHGPLQSGELVESGQEAGNSVESDVPGLAGVESDGGDTDLVLQYVSVDRLSVNPWQPRQIINDVALEQLAQSIRQDGVMQPLIVRPDDKNRYQIVAGERRWRAARLASLDQVPVWIRELDDRQMAEWAIVENLQREDLNAIERAEAFVNLIEQFHMSHDQIAERVGLERPTISNLIRLIDLCEFAADAIRNDLLSAGHGRALLGVADQQQQAQIAKKVITGGWSVRKTEAYVRSLQHSQNPGEMSQKAVRDAHLDDLAKQLTSQLGTRVKLKPGRKKGSGTLTIDFFSLDQFDALMAKLGVSIE